MVLITLTLIGAASFAQEWRKEQQASTTKIVSSEALRLHGRVGSDVRAMMGAGAKVMTDSTTGATTLSFSLSQPFKREGEPIAQINAYSASLPTNLRNLGYEAVLSANNMSGSTSTVIITSKNGSLVNSNEGAYDVTTFYHPQGLTPNSIVANIYCNKRSDSVGDLVVFGSSDLNTGNVASATCAATGGATSVVGNYCVHTFTSSGTFTLSSAKSVEVLVVAGGGAGGTDRGGGGGAGGLVYNPSFAVAPGTVTVTVGAGGIKSPVDSSKGGNGGNSVFGSLTAIGGGGGGSENIAYGSSGGSGGGNAYPGAGVPGTGTSGQGNNGGIGLDSYPTSRATGGGGGAGSAGLGGGVVPNGGYGRSYSISGTSVYYAGGGGGGSANLGGGGPGAGAGGIGGGGNGGPTSGPGSDATPNTGGGGGGGGSADSNGRGGNGGSGIVIVRYPASSPAPSSIGYYYAVNYSEPGGRSYIRNYYAPSNSSATMQVTYPDNTLLYFESIFSPNAAQNRTSIHYTKSSSGALILPFDTNATGVVRDYSLFKESVTLANGSNTPEWRSDCSRGGCYYFDGTGNYMYVPGGVALTGAEIPLPLGSERIADPWFESFTGTSDLKDIVNDGAPDTWYSWGTQGTNNFDIVEAVSGANAQSYVSARISTIRSASTARLYTTVSKISPSTAYTLSFWSKDTGFPGRYTLQINNTCLAANGVWTDACNSFFLTTHSSTYTQNYLEFTTPAGTAYQDLTISFYGGSQPGAVYYDSASLKQSTGFNGGFESYYTEGGTASAGPVQ